MSSTEESIGGRPVHGIRTARFAVELAKLLAEHGLDDRYRVLCSHPGESRDDLAIHHVLVRKLTYFLGDGRTRRTWIGAADVVVASQDTLDAALVIEVEESPRGLRPKGIVADAVTLAIADRLEVRGEAGGPIVEELDLNGCEVWIACHPSKSDDRGRAAAIEARLQELLAAWRYWRTHRGLRPGPATIRVWIEGPGDVPRALASRALARLTVGRPARTDVGASLSVDPEVCHGALTFQGTRVTVAPVLDAVARGATIEQVLSNWPQLSRAAVEEALQLAKAALLERWTLPMGPRP